MRKNTLAVLIAIFCLLMSPIMVTTESARSLFPSDFPPLCNKGVRHAHDSRYLPVRKVRVCSDEGAYPCSFDHLNSYLRPLVDTISTALVKIC